MGRGRPIGRHAANGTCNFMWALGRDEELTPTTTHRAHRCNKTVKAGKHSGNHRCKCGRQHGQ